MFEKCNLFKLILSLLLNTEKQLGSRELANITQEINIYCQPYRCEKSHFHI